MPRKAPTYAPIDVTPPTAPADADLLADGVMTVNEAAAFLGHKRRWLFEQVAAGTVPSFVLGGKRVFPKRGLVKWLGEEMRKATTHGGN